MNRIEVRTEERNSLLAHARAMLLGDDRVVFAWMYGSFGRGTEDAWSDLDIWVVLKDEAYAGVAQGRREFARNLGEPLIFVEAPQNGPPDGMYLMAVHDAPTGPHMIDWRFQPLSSAWKPESKQVLVERVDLPVADREIPFCGNATWNPTPKQDNINIASMFMVMSLVQGKAIARNPHEVGMAFGGFIQNLLRQVAEYRGVAMQAADHGGIADPEEKFDLLFGYAKQFRSIAPEHESAAAAVVRFLKFARENSVCS